jgi:CheY-like chemotaxis protein
MAQHAGGGVTAPQNGKSRGDAGPPEPGASSTGTILVVEDDPINRMLLERNLTNEGHTVHSVPDGRAALELLTHQSVDIVLLDIVMPELDGISVLEQLKAHPELRQIPVIMISAVDEAQSVIACIELGADDYLPKPFDPVLLRARINAGLTKKRLHDLERQRVRDVFVRFLPEPIVDRVISLSGEDLRLGGTLCTGTILFNDIRSFTSFAEATPPAQTLEVLNMYLGEMSDAVLDAGGSLLAYLGDGMMAAFGAPIEMDDHADRALRASIEMVTVRLPRLNEQLRRAGIADGFRIGVGLASGTFMAGNVGSARRLDYTAIGDVPNTAARLESMTKQLRFPIALTDSTRLSLQVPDEIELVPVGEVEVRGKATLVGVWAPALATAGSASAAATRW